MARNSQPVKANWLTVCFDQLGLLLWKNYKLQIRSIILTILEILVPVSRLFSLNLFGLLNLIFF